MLFKREISKIIFKGPESIHNKSYSVDYDCILNLMLFSFHSSKISTSYTIYVDNTNNKHKKFLNPIFRYSEYESIKNLSLPKVEYFKISKKYLQTLNEFVFGIDSELSNTKFIKAGLILDRIPPDGCADIWDDFNNNFSLELFRWNFCQKINYRFGVQNGNPNKLAKALIELKNFCDANKNNFSQISIEESYNSVKAEFLKKNYKKGTK